VVVPFRGTPAEFAELCRCLAAVRLAEGDSLVVVDNTPGTAGDRVARSFGIEVVHAAELAAPGYARNRGAERGTAEWIVFLDADTVPDPDLLDRYFSPPPGERTALLAGGVRDEPVSPGGRPAARYAYIRGLMGQENTFRFGQWSFPQTANAACRREAFAAAGGFREEIRAGEDADLTFRLKAAGWGIERREAARVVHRSRQTVRGLVRQKLTHGAGAAWLARQHPGSFPARRRPGLLWWGARRAAAGLIAAARRRDRDRALWALFEPLEHLSYEFGRSLRNDRVSRG
jgi:GT2 family glycosyltransferase